MTGLFQLQITGRGSQVAGRKKTTTQLINRVVIVFFMV